MSKTYPPLNDPKALMEYIRDEINNLPSTFDFIGYPQYLQKEYIDKFNATMEYIKSCRFKISMNSGFTKEGIDYNSILNYYTMEYRGKVRKLRNLYKGNDKECGFKVMLSRCKYRVLKCIGRNPVVC